MSGDTFKPIGQLPAGVVPTKSAERAKHKVSKRSAFNWNRMRAWYPNKLAEEPPADYCSLIDAAGREQLAAALATMKVRHLSWPPTFPEFALLFTEQASSGDSIDWPARQAKLEAYCEKRYGSRISFEQWRLAKYSGTSIPKGPVTFTAIHFPAVGGHAALTVTLEEAGV
jgi:hypothetical protein